MKIVASIFFITYTNTAENLGNSLNLGIIKGVRGGIGIDTHGLRSFHH